MLMPARTPRLRLATPMGPTSVRLSHRGPNPPGDSVGGCVGAEAVELAGSGREQLHPRTDFALVGVASAACGPMPLGAVDGPATAAAEPIAMAPKSYDKLTRDGWQLNILLDQESVNSVPDLANTKESREGFVTLSGTATATGGDTQIADSLFIAGYQLGCQTDASAGVQHGVSGGVSPIADLGLLELGVAGGPSGFV